MPNIDPQPLGPTASPTFSKVYVTAPITENGQLATKSYADAISHGLVPHPNCQVATTANLVATYDNGTSGVGATLTMSSTGVLTIDGYNVQLNDRILVKNQTSLPENGIYYCSTEGTVGVAAILTRATDYDTPSEMEEGTLVYIVNGTAEGRTQYFQTSADVVTVGTSDVEYEQYSIQLGALALLNTVGDSQVSTGISATKIADGSVTNTEFQYLDGVTSNIQTQIDSKLSTMSYVEVVGPANYASDFNESIVSVTSGGDVTVNLPTTLSTNLGRRIIIYQGANTGQTTISTNSGSIFIDTGATSGAVSSINLNAFEDFVILSPMTSQLWALESDVTSSDLGALAYLNTVGTTQIDDSSVTNAKMANMSSGYLKGRASVGSGAPEDLTAADATALLNAMVGDSGSGGTKGLVPAPASGDTAAGKFLKADGNWEVPSGSGGAGFADFNYTPDATVITSNLSKDFGSDNGKMFYVSATGGNVSITLNNAADGTQIGFSRTDSSFSNQVTITSGANTYKLLCSNTIFIANKNDNDTPTPTLKQVNYAGWNYAHPYIGGLFRKTTAGDARYYLGLPDYVNSGTFDFNDSAYELDGEWISDTTTSNVPFSLAGNNWRLKTSLSGSYLTQTATKIDSLFPIVVQREYNGSSWSSWYYPEQNFDSGYNDTGVGIASNQVCHIYYDAVDTRFEIAEAQANNATNIEGSIGFAIAGISSTATGTIMTKGILRSVDTSSYTVGDTLYLSDSGEGTFTNTAPTTIGSYIVELGMVTISHATAGEIEVNVKPAVTVTGQALQQATSHDAAIAAIGLKYGVIDGSTGGILDSSGVSSVSKLSTGQYKVTMSAAFSGSYPMILSTCYSSSTGNDTIWSVKVTGKSTDNFRLECIYDNGSARGYFDPTEVHFAVYE